MTGRLPLLALLIFLGAALLEVGGDATIRQGLRSGRGTLVVTGCVMLAAYGVLVNVVTWDFSRLLGVYVAVFALVSVLFGRVLFQEMVPISTWVGLGMIVAGGAVIQFGSR
jgi:drug/metabolite transporter superfamily protein YnfA